MWYKNNEQHSNLTKPVADVLPSVTKHHLEKGRVLGATSYSKLHYHHTMTLKEISPVAKLPQKPIHLRLIEADDNGPVAIHAVSLKKDKPELLTTFLGQDFIANYHLAIQKIKTVENDETKGEIRSLSVPALNVEAIWLHYENEKPDQFALIWEFKPADKKVLNEEKFIGRLNQMKAKLGEIEGERGA